MTEHQNKIDSSVWTGERKSSGRIESTHLDFKKKAGTFIQGKGIYAGTLDKISYETPRCKYVAGPFNLFAARSDLTLRTSVINNLVQYNYHNLFNALVTVSRLERYDDTLYDGFKQYRYNKGKKPEHELVLSLMAYHSSNRGFWFIPTPDMLDMLYEHRNEGAFAKSFKTAVNEESKGHTYLSCRADFGEKLLDPTFCRIHLKDFTNGESKIATINNEPIHSIRLVRLEPADECAYDYKNTLT